MGAEFFSGTGDETEGVAPALQKTIANRLKENAEVAQAQQAVENEFGETFSGGTVIVSDGNVGEVECSNDGEQPANLFQGMPPPQAAAPVVTRRWRRLPLQV